MSLYRSSTERFRDIPLMSLYRLCRDIILSRYSSVTDKNYQQLAHLSNHLRFFYCKLDYCQVPVLTLLAVLWYTVLSIQYTLYIFHSTCTLYIP